MSRSRAKKQSTDKRTVRVSGRKRQTAPKLPDQHGQAPRHSLGAGNSPRSARLADRRIQRTRRLLHQAIVELILERGWDAIHVQDVCERADVGRSTFYVHFADKEELLVSGFGELRGHLRESAAAAGAKPLAFTRALLDHTREFEPLYRALLGRRTAEVVHRSWIEVVSELLEEDVAKLAPAGPLRDATVRYLAGALWELLIWWSEQPRRSSSVDLDEIFRRLTLAVLRELR